MYRMTKCPLDERAKMPAQKPRRRCRTCPQSHLCRPSLCLCPRTTPVLCSTSGPLHTHRCGALAWPLPASPSSPLLPFKRPHIMALPERKPPCSSRWGSVPSNGLVSPSHLQWENLFMFDFPSKSWAPSTWACLVKHCIQSLNTVASPPVGVD